MVSFLAINCGSSSVKIALFEAGSPLPKKIHESKVSDLTGKTYDQTIAQLVQAIDRSSLQGIGHRVVHGGEKYAQSTVITGKVISELEKLCELAPLHNPPSLEGIACSQRLFPKLPQIACFDTAFHAHLLPEAALYPIPIALSEKYHIKRYGFHGIAHAFSCERYTQFSPKGKRLITVHLGNGCSLAAIRDGISLDTSMGFTPLDGVMMSSRSGELDPAIVSFLCDKERKTASEVIDMLNCQSGLFGIAQSSDMQQVLKNAETNPQTKLALDMFISRIQKKIGSYMAVLQGTDAIVFSGGIGENSAFIRKRIVDAFSWCGATLDEKQNDSAKDLNSGEIRRISQKISAIDICVVGSDENLFIAHEVQNILRRGVA